MKESHVAVLEALGHIHPERPLRDERGRFAAQNPLDGRVPTTARVSLGGGVGYSPLPPAPRNGVADHDQMLRELLSPQTWGA